jgi:hypothetical protein
MIRFNIIYIILYMSLNLWTMLRLRGDAFQYVIVSLAINSIMHLKKAIHFQKYNLLLILLIIIVYFS